MLGWYVFSERLIRNRRQSTLLILSKEVIFTIDSSGFFIFHLSYNSFDFTCNFLSYKISTRRGNFTPSPTLYPYNGVSVLACGVVFWT